MKTKQVELIVRFNFTVPADTKIDDLFLRLPVDQITVHNKLTETIESKCEGFETMEVNDLE